MDWKRSPQNTAAPLRELRRWYQQPVGAKLLRAEQDLLREVLSDVFGYHLVVVDPPSEPAALDSSRILHRVIESCTPDELERPPDIICATERLSLKSDSVDAFVLSHVLELVADPHKVLREIDRCLVAEGHVIILGFTPLGWWGARKLLCGWRGQIPWSLRFISLPRVKDWLSLLGFDTVQSSYLFPHLPWQNSSGSCKENMLDRIHRPHWPLLAACWLLVARKQVASVTPIRPRWRPRRAVLSGGVAETRHGGMVRHG